MHSNLTVRTWKCRPIFVHAPENMREHGNAYKFVFGSFVMIKEDLPAVLLFDGCRLQR